MIGSTFGSYRIVSQLGAGGMGVVYKAFDTRLQRHVAVKMLPASVSSDEGRRRLFLREARAASALNDPHIVSIHDIFEHQGTDVLVMELVEGRTLRDAMGEAPIGIAQALEWTRQIAEGLGVAHGAGVIHRDLKPGNIMLTDRGVLKVLDFGLAKVMVSDEDATLAPETKSGDVLGTIEYMAPEQARGRPVDHRTDIYALGTILYQLLAGRRPFEAENRLALLHEIAHGTPPPVRSFRPEVSDVIDDVVARALTRDPQLRFQSMWEFGAALKFAASAAPASTPTGPSMLDPGSSWPAGAVRALNQTAPSAPLPIARTRRLVWAGVGTAALIAVMVVVLSPWADRDTPPAPMPTSATPQRATPALSGTALELTEQGLMLIRRYDKPGNIDAAIVRFEAAITQDERFAPAWAGLARAYWQQQRATRDASWTARALDAAKQAVALDPYLANGQVSLGFARMITGDTAAARQDFAGALVLDPANPGAHRGMAAIARAENRLADARNHYAKALASDPTDWDLMWLQGELDFNAARYAEALAWFQRAAEAAPDSAVPYRLMGGASHMLGDYAAAATALQRSIALQPTAGGYTNLGTALFFQGHYRGSVQAFERAVEMQPSSPLYWGNLGDAYRWVPGNADKAKDAYARAIQLQREQIGKDPSQTVNRSRLALYLAKSGDITSALKELDAVLTPNVADVNSLYRGAVTYELAGRRAEALATLERALVSGYGVIEVRSDPELANLRTDVRYHRLMARVERAATK